jgi:3-hydroxybutyryl-CoA dehydrogenase
MINIESINTIVVCGAGTMGAGIAQVAATAGYQTVLFDVNEAALQKARGLIESQLAIAVNKGKLSAEGQAATLGRIYFTSVLKECRAELVIEAVIEKPDVKISLFTQLASVNERDTIFASNTSSLGIDAIAAGVPHPERVAGMHFFNPAPVMKLVEIIRGKQTAPATVELLYALAKDMGKTPVMASDTPGFIVNRVARHYYLEAMELAASGVAGYKTIDRLLESAGFRMGPFALMDLIGNDINLAVTQSLYDAFNKAPRFKPNALQVNKVNEGALGKKTGKGFYNYE